MQSAMIVHIYVYMGIHVHIFIDFHILMSKQSVGDLQLCSTVVVLTFL